MITLSSLEACVMATDRPNDSRTGCAAEGDVFERATMASVVGRDMNSDCKLLLGDCLDVLKSVESGSADMVLADLPYGTTACKWDNVIPFEPLWSELNRVCKSTAAMVMFGQEPFISQMVMSNLENQKYKWIWDKKFAGNFSTANKRPLNTVEEVCVFYRKQPTYNPQMVLRDKPITSGKRCNPGNRSKSGLPTAYEAPKKNYDKKYPTAILHFPRELGRAKLHPTQKPVALLEYLIKTYTNEGDTVLDPTMGSGSTGVACKNLNRKFIGIEKDCGYFEIARDRIKAAKRANGE